MHPRLLADGTEGKDCSPTGRVLAEAGEAPELIVVDIDAETVATARRVLPVLANARDL